MWFSTTSVTAPRPYFSLARVMASSISFAPPSAASGFCRIALSYLSCSKILYGLPEAPRCWSGAQCSML